jgi:LysM repeat protein
VSILRNSDNKRQTQNNESSRSETKKRVRSSATDWQNGALFRKFRKQQKTETDRRDKIVRFSIFKNFFKTWNYFREAAGRSGNLRIKICLSDGQTDVMEFSSDVNTSTFLSLISQKFNVPVSTLAQIRSGHPPKVMDQTKSNSPVEFSNGDRVQITLGPASATTSISAPLPSSGAR